MNETFSTAPAAAPRGSNLTPKKPFVAKGHDKDLLDAQNNRHATTIFVAGEDFVGTIVRRDKFTITLRHETVDGDVVDEIFYKHAIERVRIVRHQTLVN